MHDAILKNQLGEKTSQESFRKVFKPITTKVDDFALSNVKLPKLQTKRGKKMAVPDYGIQAGDDQDIPDYALDDLFEEGIQPEQNKQLVPKPPTYEESLADVLEGKKQIYVDPQYLPLEPPEFDEDEVPDYALDEEDRTNEILKDLEINDYDNVEKIISQPEMTPKKTRSYLKKVIYNANLGRNQLKGYESRVTHAYKKGEIGEGQRAQENKRMDDARVVLNQYIKYYETKVKGIKGSGNRKRGGNVMFFNNLKTLLKKS